MERDISIEDALTNIGLKILNSNREEDVLLIQIEIWAKPGAKREKVSVSDGGHLIVSTQAPPEDGKANEGIMKLMAKKLGVSKTQIELVSGHQSKFKIMAITFVFSHNKDEDFFISKIKAI